MIERRIVHLFGRVQGVGFRDHVVRLAREFAVAGTVRNTAGGVEIDCEGEPSELDRWLNRLEHDVPRGASVSQRDVQSAPLVRHRGFVRT